VQVSRRSVAALIAAAAVAALAAGCGDEAPEPNPPVTPDPAFGEQPNIVFVLTDDQDYASYNRRTMPNTYRLLGEQGVTFANHVDTTPLCCPSRAALQSGQYGHNNGVLNNKPGYADLEGKDNLLPVWLQRAGYSTAYVGKFMNGYDSYVDDKDDVAPGWDRWSILSGNALGYLDFRLAVDGRQRKEEFSGEYMTDVLNDRAAELIGELSGPEPFYLQLGQLAPHVENLNANSGGPCGGDAVPPERDAGRFEGVQLPDLPAVLEEDVSDKPAMVSGLPALDAAKREQIRERYQCRLETLPAVDRGIAQIVEALREAGELDDTIIAYASDNGNFHGQHGLPGGKGLPYEQAAHVPFVVRVPPRYRGAGEAGIEVTEATANIDYVPTVVEWAGAETCPEAGDCRVMDGRSLMPLIEGRDNAWPQQRPILTELDIGKEQLQSGRGISCRYEGVRQGEWVYIQHTSLPDLSTGVCEETDTVELYNHATDPFELDNLTAVAAGSRVVETEERLATLTDELADCAGIEGRDPEPASGHYCG
jgi:N-acetylglucosamine-6-sulfatase